MRKDSDIIVSGTTDFILDEIMKRMGIKNYVGSSIDKKQENSFGFVSLKTK